MTIALGLFGGYLILLALAYLLGQWVGRRLDTENEEHTDNDWNRI